jgi:D-erythro-7,8-dihydroneopterin triphosphate epimerase
MTEDRAGSSQTTERGGEHVPRTLDRVFIRDLALRCIIGLDEHERQEKQDILVHLTMYTDVRRAGRTDRLEDTIDYRALKKRILHLVGESQFHLVEALAQSIAEECLRDERIAQVEVVVEKPGALRFARTVGVAIVRSKEGNGQGA